MCHIIRHVGGGIHMFCPKCGLQNPDNAVQCPACGTALHADFGQGNAPRVPNYLVWAILLTLFCCMPLGIPAIVFASQVDSRQNVGDFYGAMEASRKAKLFCWLSFGLGLGVIVIYLAIVIFSILVQAY
jgi:hypothetical protein